MNLLSTTWSSNAQLTINSKGFFNLRFMDYHIVVKDGIDAGIIVLPISLITLSISPIWSTIICVLLHIRLSVLTNCWTQWQCKEQKTSHTPSENRSNNWFYLSDLNSVVRRCEYLLFMTQKSFQIEGLARMG